MARFGSMMFWIALSIFMSAGIASAGTARFAVIADPHFYDTDLGTTGTAFEAYLAQDRKMLRESEAILVSALEEIKAQAPDFLIIPGDLTKDGELSSHEKLADYLADMEAAGIEVFVVPGNHDINNPHAVAFEGDSTIAVDMVTPEDFERIYGPFGYDQAVDRAPDSLSYIVEPVDGVWLLGIDSCRYDNNVADGSPETGGTITEETLSWILDKLFEAKLRRKTVAGFIHHGILEHYSGQAQMDPDYVVENWEDVSETLSAASLRLIFSGHYHANDITQTETEDLRLYDVETGSLVTYPSPYRMVDLHGHNAAAIRTFHVDAIDTDTQGQSFPDYARDFLEQGITTIAAYQLTLPVEEGGFAFSSGEAQNAAPFVAEAFIAHYAGDETPDATVQMHIQEFLESADPRYQGLSQALETLWTDLPPADNHAMLTLNPAIALKPVGTYVTHSFDEGAAEICAYDPDGRTLFVANGDKKVIDMLDISDPALPLLTGSIDVTPYGYSPNSVAVHDGLVAVAVEAEVAQEPGQVVLFDTSGNFLKAFQAGALPDMVTFTPDGRYLLVANEGEPNDDYSMDPEGSVSIIDLSQGLERPGIKTAHFRQFDRSKASLLAEGVRIFGPNATVAQDLEPEYICVLPHSPIAWVSLQENNAIAKINIPAGRVLDIIPLGFKDHGLPENRLDVSDTDDAININNFNGLMGMYQPDAIAAYRYQRNTYIVTANEGDSRNYNAFSEEAHVGDLSLDPAVFPNADLLQSNPALGRLTVTNTIGDNDSDGDFDQLYAFGGRSFSIFKVAPQHGWVPVFDSGDQFEQIIAAALPEYFNSDNDNNDSFDSRSVAKGPEPEGVVIGNIWSRRGRRTYAFIGLERMGGIMVYDITVPYDPEFVQYINNRSFSSDVKTAAAGDLGPEGIAFIPAHQSPDGTPMLAVANEVSGTTCLYHIDVSGNGSRGGRVASP